MIPIKQEIHNESFGLGLAHKMSIHEDSLAHVMSVLGNLYSNPLRSVLVEYSSNAYDSHVAAGKKDVPIKVTLPSILFPELVIEDEGVGLTEEEVYEVYSSYGVSTKRGSNDFIGQLGFGSKSAFSYSDSFTVTATKNGIRGHYLFRVNQEGGEVVKLGEEEGFPDGVRVSIPIKKSDFSKLEGYTSVFSFWEIPPEGIDVKPYTPVASTKVGKYKVETDGERDYNKDIVLIGSIPYPVPQPRSSKHVYLPNLVIHSPIGELEFTPNREELKQTQKLASLVEDAREALLTKLHEDLITLVDNSENWVEACSRVVEYQHKYPAIFKRKFSYKGYDIGDLTLDSPLPSVRVSKTKNDLRLHPKTTDCSIDMDSVFLITDLFVGMTEKGRKTLVGSSKEKAALREFVKDKSHVILVRSIKDIPVDVEVLGVPVVELKNITPPVKTRSKKKSILLREYIMTPSMYNQLQTVSQPPEGSSIVVIPIHRNNPIDKYQNYDIRYNHHLLGCTVYAATPSNIEKLRKVYNITEYGDALIEALKKKIKAIGVSVLRNFSPIEYKSLAGLSQYKFTDPKVSAAVKKANDVYDFFDSLPRRRDDREINALKCLIGIGNTEEFLSSFLPSHIKPSEDLLEGFSDYPLARHLIDTEADPKDIAEYLNGWRKKC